MSARTCEHNKDNVHDLPRCRKRATLAVQYRVRWGERLRGDGPPEPVYLSRITFRCPLHERVADMVATMGISDYFTALENQA